MHIFSNFMSTVGMELLNKGVYRSGNRAENSVLRAGSTRQAALYEHLMQISHNTYCVLANHNSKVYFSLVIFGILQNGELHIFQSSFSPVSSDHVFSLW